MQYLWCCYIHVHHTCCSVIYYDYYFYLKELAGLALSCVLNKTPLVPTKSEEDRAREAAYKKCLSLDRHQLPDPFMLPDSAWTCEKDGMANWPPTMYFDIADYLRLVTIHLKILVILINIMFIY